MPESNHRHYLRPAVNGQFLGGNAEIQAMGKAVKKKFVEAGVVM